MFNPTPEDLWSEIEKAVELTERRTKHSLDLVRRYTSRWYDQSVDYNNQESDPENFCYAYVSNMLPALTQANPRVKVEAARVVGHQQVAQAMTDGIDAVVDDIHYSQTSERVALDFLFSRGIMLHRIEPERRSSRGIVTPNVRRVSPSRFFIDSLAASSQEAEMMGHWYYMDLDDLLADEQVLPAVREKLVAMDEASNSLQGRTTAYRKPDGSEVGRKRVRCYNVWLRQRGTIRVMCEADQTSDLYPEMPLYGPEDGPYELFDAHPVQDEAWPLPPLLAVKDQNDDLNEHARAMGRAARRRKSLGLVEASNTDLGNKLTNAEDGSIFPVRGITGQYVQIEVGGATKEQYQFTEYIRNRLDRISGLTATVQGNVGAADTATEASIADAHLNARVDYLKRKFVEATERSLRKIGWYLFHTEGIIIPVNRRDPYSGEMIEGMFFGGPAPTDLGATWHDFKLRVVINSMQRQQQAKDNLLGFFSIFMQIAQIAPQMPWLRAMNIIRDLESAFDLEGKGDEWMIPELFGAFGQPPMAPPSMLMGGADVPPMVGQGGANPGRNWPRNAPRQQLANGTQQGINGQLGQTPAPEGGRGMRGSSGGRSGGGMSAAGVASGPRPGGFAA